MSVRGGPLLSAAAPELTCKPSDMRAATPFRHHTVVGTRCREQCLSPVRSWAYRAPSAEYDRYSTSDRPGNCQTRYAAKAVRSPRLSATCSKWLVKNSFAFRTLGQSMSSRTIIPPGDTNSDQFATSQSACSSECAPSMWRKSTDLPKILWIALHAWADANSIT